MILINLVFFFAIANAVFAQTKVSGIVVDKSNRPIPFANIAFKNSNKGVVSNEDGQFYLESNKIHKTLSISFVGYISQDIQLAKDVNYNMVINLVYGQELKEVKIYKGKTAKKNNPAIDILRKIWARKHKNGLHLFDQYQMEAYEKVEFDLNSIDSAYMKSSIFKVSIGTIVRGFNLAHMFKIKKIKLLTI